MSDTNSAFTSAANFGKLVPGFDFLQSLAAQAVKGASSGLGNIPQLPNPANWVAPTLNVEELEKRIDELKTVQFWLDQNANALKATITALEVQKMTLATLKGMNFNMGDVANAFKLKATETVAQTVSSAFNSAATSTLDKTGIGAAAEKSPAKKPQASASEKSAGLIDPMQWWGSLTQQFGQIAATAMKDAGKQTALDTTRHMAQAMTKTAMNSAKSAAKSAVKSTAKAAAKVAGDAAKDTAKTIAKGADFFPASGSKPRKTAKKAAIKTRVKR